MRVPPLKIPTQAIIFLSPPQLTTMFALSLLQYLRIPSSPSSTSRHQAINDLQTLTPATYSELHTPLPSSTEIDTTLYGEEAPLLSSATAPGSSSSFLRAPDPIMNWQYLPSGLPARARAESKGSASSRSISRSARSAFSRKSR